MKRSIVIEQSTSLRLSSGLLEFETDAGVKRVPIEDLSIIVLDQAAIQVTEKVLAKLSSSGVVLIVCDEKHLPCGYLFPYQAHGLMPDILRKQVQVSLPTKKRLWQQIVQEKIMSQARFLQERFDYDFGLIRMASSVRSGDVDNREGAAAAVYFPALFGSSFVRMRGPRVELYDTDPSRELLVNAMLNYGYAILRAMVARCLAATGLHPTFGIQHRHRENAFALVDDLLEPLRVLVDRMVYFLLPRVCDDTMYLTPMIKRELLQILRCEISFQKERWTLDSALEGYCSSFRSCLFGESRKLLLPSV
ncbi:MAG: type II CRISPR-associated endonuclease Cas1 [Fimbriimonadaceae bacterium]